jgi:prenyl protein peptidase
LERLCGGTAENFLKSLNPAPVTEEIIYRGCLFPLLAPTFGRNLYILINSIFFGLAHFHHLFEHRHLPWPSWKKKFHLSIMQSGFTFTFAIYNTYFYLCTGRILTPIVIHILCNAIGFPRFQEIASHPHRKGLIILFLGGLISFIIMCFVLSGRNFCKPLNI